MGYHSCTVTHLEEEKRAALSRALREGRERKRWNVDKTAEEAMKLLRQAAQVDDQHRSPRETRLYREIEISRHHVTTLEHCPATPLSTLERRVRLLGIVLALELDAALINRLAGGI